MWKGHCQALRRLVRLEQGEGDGRGGSGTSEVGEGHNVGRLGHQRACTLFKVGGIVHRKTTIKDGGPGKMFLQHLAKGWWWLYPRWKWSQQDLLMNWILGGRDEKSKGMPAL